MKTPSKHEQIKILLDRTKHSNESWVFVNDPK